MTKMTRLYGFCSSLETKNTLKKEEVSGKGLLFLPFTNWQSRKKSVSASRCDLAIYGPIIYTAPYVMLFDGPNPLLGQVRGGWALEIETFLDPVKWHRTVRRVSFGAQKLALA
jgi:hypothetical protein